GCAIRTGRAITDGMKARFRAGIGGAGEAVHGRGAAQYLVDQFSNRPVARRRAINHCLLYETAAASADVVSPTRPMSRHPAGIGITALSVLKAARRFRTARLRDRPAAGRRDPSAPRCRDYAWR